MPTGCSSGADPGFPGRRPFGRRCRFHFPCGRTRRRADRGPNQIQETRHGQVSDWLVAGGAGVRAGDPLPVLPLKRSLRRSAAGLPLSSRYVGGVAPGGRERVLRAERSALDGVGGCPGSRALVHLNPACTAGFRGLPVKIRPRGAEGPRPAPRQPGAMPATLRGRPRSKTLPTLPPATALAGRERRVSARRGLRQQERAGASADGARSLCRCGG